MEQGLIDIRNKAREKSKKFGKWSPYEISCETLIAILDELESRPTPLAPDVCPLQAGQGSSDENSGAMTYCFPRKQGKRR